MAINPLQRPMFRVPGVNPGQVAGSILPAQGGIALPPTQPVAAQPLSLKELIPQARAVLNNPNSDPVQVASLTTQLNEKGIPPEALTTNVAAQPLVVGGEAAKEPPVQVATHKAVDLFGPDATAEEKAIQEVYGQITQGLTHGDSGEGAEGAEGASEENVQRIVNAAQAATSETVRRGEVPEEEASAATNRGKAAAAAILNAEENFDEQIAAVTMGGDLEGATSKNYNELAKEYLGLDKAEADVPEWAAPMFLFGLNLMKAPVSTATRDTGLGGLLADIGKAGEVGFASFATERARKRKERIAIGQMALDLKKTDSATQVAAATAKVKSAQWWANHLLQQEKEKRLVGTEARLTKEGEQAKADRYASFIAQRNDTITNRFTKDANVEDRGAFIEQFDNILNNIAPEAIEGVYKNPSYLNLIGTIAAKRAGLQPDFKTETLTFGSGQELEYSVNALKRYARDNNTTQEKVLSAITKDPENSKYAGIAVALNLGKDQVDLEYRPSEGGAVKTPVYINKRAMIEEQKKAQKENRAVDPKKFETLGTPYLNAKPDFKKIVLGNVGGVEKYAYVDLAKLTELNFARKKAKKAPIDLIAALQTPTLAPGVVSKEYSNTSGALDNLSVVKISTGPYTKQQFLFNKNTLDTKQKEIAKELGIPENQVEGLIASGTNIPWEVLQKTGVFTPTGKQEKTLKPVTKTVLGRDGAFVTMTGEPGQLAGMESAAEQAKLRDRVQNTTIANRASHIVTGILEEAAERDSAGLVTSKWSTFLGKAVAIPNLFGYTTGNSFTKLKNFDLHSDSTKEDRARTIGMLDTWSDKFDSSAKGILTDEADRQRLKSLFTDLAFSMASAREGGKLTDNDIRWAFETLGFNSEDYLQNPSKVLAGLRTAIGTINTGTEMRLMEIHEDAAAIRKNNLDPKNPKRYILDEVLAAKWAGVRPREDGRDRWIDPNSKEVIYRYERRPKSSLEVGGTKRAPAGAPAQTPPAGQPVVQYNVPGRYTATIPLIAPLTIEERGLVKQMQEAGVARNIEGVMKHFGTLSPVEARVIQSLNKKGFFD